MDATRIRELNDVFRNTFTGGQVMLTSGVSDLPQKSQLAVIDSVKSFATFTKDNDPNSEHDFGSITVDDNKFFWKIARALFFIPRPLRDAVYMLIARMRRHLPGARVCLPF